MKRARRQFVGVGLIVALAAGACGGDGESDTFDTSATSLRPGDCFDSAVETAVGVTARPDLQVDADFNVVNCDGPHDGEVVAIDTTERGTEFGFCPDKIEDYFDGEQPAGTTPYGQQRSAFGDEASFFTICTVVRSETVTAWLAEDETP